MQSLYSNKTLTPCLYKKNVAYARDVHQFRKSFLVQSHGTQVFDPSSSTTLQPGRVPLLSKNISRHGN